MTRRSLTWCWSFAAALAALSVSTEVSSAGLSLGTARGTRSAELSFDGGKRWLALGGKSLPVLDSTEMRTTSGSILLDLTDGSRLNVHPYSAMRVVQTGGTTEVTLTRGRLSFRLPVSTQATIATFNARFEPVRTEGMVGEVFVGGATGLKLTRGNLRVRDGSGRQLVVAGLKPVFVPKRPAVAGPLFTSDVAAGTIPDGAKAIFSARGESLGYLDPEGQFVVSPGYTSDLTRPFAPRIVQAALANVPPKDRADAELLFDVNGEYVGYVVGPVFYAQTELAAGAAVSGASRIDRGAASVAPGAIAGTAAAGGAAVHRSGSVGTTGTEVAAGTAVHEAGTAGPAGAGVKAFSLNGDNGCATPIDPKDRRCF